MYKERNGEMLYLQKVHKKINYGFTITEILIATIISFIFFVLVMEAFILSGNLLAQNAKEAQVRAELGHLFTRIEYGIQNASSFTIYSSYDNLNASNYGSCVFITNSQLAQQMGVNPANSMAFYYYNPTSDPFKGALYFDPDTSTNPNPLTDRKLATHIVAFEVRNNLNNTIRVAIKADIRGVKQRAHQGAAGNYLIVSESCLPRPGSINQ